MEAKEGTFTLVRRFVGKSVERELYTNGELVYNDRMSKKMFIYKLEHLDILTALEQFSFGECGLYIGEHATDRSKNRNYFIQLLHFIRLKLKTYKLNFGINLFNSNHTA